MSCIKSKVDKPDCSVCGEVGDGLHFGADACRACAAFFRRTIVLEKQYECRVDGRCTINTIIRSICKACRLEKCIEVGMKPSGVQPRRENLGRREDDPPGINVPDPVIPDAPLLFKPSLDTMPILEKMRISYEKLENARNVIYRKDGENVFEPKVSRAISFREALDITSTEVSLVADYMEWCFEDFGSLPVDQKTVIFQNFFPYFYTLERGFLTCRYGDRTKMIMPSRDYVDFSELIKFFSVPELGINGEYLAKVFEPFLELQERSLFALMRQESVDFYEFLALSTLLFWDYGLDGQSDDCSQLGRRIKMSVSKEMNFYYTNVKKVDDPVCRVSAIVGILPALQRVVYRLRENISLAHIFDAYKIPLSVYNIVNGVL